MRSQRKLGTRAVAMAALGVLVFGFAAVGLTACQQKPKEKSVFKLEAGGKTLVNVKEKGDESVSVEIGDE